MPRPESEIDLSVLEKLSSLQCTDEGVAAFFGVSTRTIERRRKVARFREAMGRGKAKGRLSVRRHLFRQAADGSAAAAIFLAKNLIGFKDVVANEHSGPDGAPIQLSLADVLRERKKSHDTA